MRRFKQGSETRVTVSAAYVADFKRRWPCSGLPTRGFSFIFASNGDLVDVAPSNVDGPALAALADDAKAYGLRA